jgi:ParB family chromosome partitioning protein
MYDLVCGQGRLEAFKAVGETHIPCFVVSVSESDAFLLSLVENLARRRHSNADLLGAIRVLQARGYSTPQIASKTGLDPKYVAVMLHLLKNGEQRLIAAVERGWLSVKLANQISRVGDTEVQAVMMEAYDKGLLRGEELLKVRRLIDKRAALGKGYGSWRRAARKKLTPNRLVETYRTEVRRQQLTVKKAEVTESRLLLILAALKKLLSDKNFRTLMRAEGIEDIPKQLADRLENEGRP